jgi:non-heme chloroperoxidase
MVLKKERHAVDVQLQTKRVPINGVELTYVEQGSGSPVVFVHGSVGDFRSWMAQIPVFAQHYHVIAYSRRYHHPHSKVNGATGYSAMVQCDDLAALIKTLGLTPAHVVGSSYGAYVSLLVAAQYPELVRSLVLGEPPAFALLSNEPGGVVDKQMQVIAASRRAFEEGDSERAIRMFIDSVIGKGTFDNLPAPVRGSMLENAAEFRLETQTPPEQYFPFSCTLAQAIRTPSLLLTGEVSPKMFWLITDELERCLPNRERAVIPGASHGMHLGNAEAYTKAVLAFLAKH